MRNTMSKLLFNTLWSICLTGTLAVMAGCSDDNNELQVPPTSGPHTAQICLDWGATKSEVMEYMKNHEMTSLDRDFVAYDGSSPIQIVSYQFDEDSLRAALAVIHSDDISLDELKASFNDYEHLGKSGIYEVYINEEANTMATISEKTTSEISYYNVGYTELR